MSNRLVVVKADGLRIVVMFPGPLSTCLAKDKDRLVYAYRKGSNLQLAEPGALLACQKLSRACIFARAQTVPLY